MQTSKVSPTIEGWNIPLSVGTNTYKIYAAAGQRILRNGDEVGSITIHNSGTAVTITIASTHVNSLLDRTQETFYRKE
jgi:hypothetical protein